MARTRRRSLLRTLASLAASTLAVGGLAVLGPASAHAADGAPPAGPGPHVGASQVPAHAVTGYWQNFDNGATVQTLAEVQDEYDIIAVAFADATGSPGQVDFNLDPALGYSEEQFKADIAAKHAEGKSVIISVGGEKGTVSVADDASAKAFSDSIVKLMDEYGFDGVDIDLENGLNSTYMTKALDAIHAAKSDVVVTMAPQTIDMQSPSNEYFKTALNIKSYLTVVNMQYYNSGSMNGCDGKVYSAGTVDFLTALACVQIKGGLDPSQVGLGTPASPRAAGSGYVDPGVVNAALDCLAEGTGCGSFVPDQKWPGIRGAMTWSTAWDAANGNKWSSTVGPHVHAM
ncbi:chitinase [Streptomyces albus]|uniref:chitinase n=1 Tax=Streptomyces TaxID=1883 RepID=UPI001CED44B1|nr:MULTISPECIES: chitinase [Streptomyces]MDI6412943.1 chitinase [Streptomyces albus]